MQELDDPIPLSALQHAVYCLRQAALIHIERLWAENRFTAEGRVLHEVPHEPANRKRGQVRRVMALPLVCRRLNLVGVADLVEFHAGPNAETAYPVEYKRGKAKSHRADEVQLCAQGLCLEEMTGKPVPEGALFYATTKRRVVVLFDTELRRLTEEAASQFGALFVTGCTPPAVYRADRCRACSLLELCRPKASAKSALGFRAREIDAALGRDEVAS
ncbi:CRISPR-associated protein Cas4 [Nitrobacter winogradskyi]|uniref:CRISPR-associated exonuclease Cas4 n=2 Tax=Nitrobacter winogradskyi TaxID=913 RepID=A0ACC6ANK6_NITWI|nr:CRISPR-associated protein Cas4 [Nitrobacter winogradskyi]MCP2000742.1 CRISPR-associated exonuclease Cas4 [Nitrobacter winogradskyi]GEC15000.1 CRISPR-associated protein Cas4 [Nitrobacter winogradskyi]